MSLLHVLFKVGATEYAVPAARVLQMESFTGVIRPNKDSARLTLNVPAERRIALHARLQRGKDSGQAQDPDLDIRDDREGRRACQQRFARAIEQTVDEIGRVAGLCERVDGFRDVRRCDARRV